MTLMAATVLVGAASGAQEKPATTSAQQPATATTAAPQPKLDRLSFCEWAPKCLVLVGPERNNVLDPYVQEVKLNLRAQYQIGALDPAGGGDRVKGGANGNGRRSNDEWRRFRLGATAKVFNDIKLLANWNVGGLNTRDAYSDGEWDRTTSRAQLDELYAQVKIKPVTLTLGKFKPAFMGEYRTSSANILTFERSLLVNQLKAEKTWGVSIKNADSKATFGWEAGVWLNGLHEGVWMEPALNSKDNATFGASVSYKLNDENRLYLDYMHSFAKEDQLLHYNGPGARDVVALTLDSKYGNLSVMTEAIAGFNTIGLDKKKGAGAENVFGFTVLPSYKFTPHWEGVMRYQISAGSNAVKGDGHFYTQNSTYSSVSDLTQGIYAGINYYVCPKDPHSMKLMLGVEYLNSEGRDATGGKGFTGWQYCAGVRVNF